MVFYFSSTFYGCLAQRENISDKQKLIEQIKQSCDNYDQTVNISANPLAQNASLSAVYPLNIQIHDDNIYVFNIMYNNVKYVSNPNLVLDEMLISCNQEITNEECFEILEKIRSTQNCYILESDDSGENSQKIAVFLIDDTYYFLSIFSVNKVSRIHYIDFNFGEQK